MALDRMATETLVKIHLELNRMVDRPGSDLAAKLREVTGLEPVKMVKGLSFSRVLIKDEVMRRATGGDLAAQEYAVTSGWVTCQEVARMTG